MRFLTSAFEQNHDFQGLFFNRQGRVQDFLKGGLICLGSLKKGHQMLKGGSNSLIGGGGGGPVH